MFRGYTSPLLAACLACAPLTSIAAALPSASFAAAPVADRELAAMVGTGGGLREDMPAIVAEQASFDRSMIASSTSDPIDAWWALVGSELIAGNLL